MATPSYLNEEKLPYPFCPGCGHGVILDHLNEALMKLQLDPRRVVIVTDIGCAGLSDKFFKTHALHGLHGRSLTYASGIKLVRPGLNVIVLIGDGGCGIGGNHLIHAARRNMGISVLVFNNLNYGMTGGEHSVTTPPGAKTATTMNGHIEQPMDICATVAANGANFVARTTAYDKGLTSLIAQAIQYEGFSLLDIWELCTAHFVPRNRFSRKALEASMQELGFQQGILQQGRRAEYTISYHRKYAQAGTPKVSASLPQIYAHNLKEPLRVVIAGAAGMRVATAATVLGRAAVLSNLWARQHNDYPVTVRSGYSVSEVTLSPQAVSDIDAAERKVIIVISSEGLERVRVQLEALKERDRLYIDERLLPLNVPASVFPLRMTLAGRKKSWGLAALSAMLRHTAIFPYQALERAIELQGEYVTENLSALECGAHLMGE